MSDPQGGSRPERSRPPSPRVGTGLGCAPADVAAWRAVVSRYARPELGLALLDLATSVLPYLGLWVLMYFALDYSEWLVLALAIPAAGFLVRTYIVFHDCAHASFLPSRRANAHLGFVLGLFVFATFQSWRHSHAVHHATAGDLDRRGIGDVPTMTVPEYRAASRPKRLGYRLLRNPLVMFGLGPIFALVVQPRFVPRGTRPRIRRAVVTTNVVLALLVGGLCWLIGWRDYLLVQGPTVMLAGAAGIWLFYVQHQFEDTYWADSARWSYADAALRGSSYLKLPRVLRFFTGNIGLHHVHHLSAKIPNYRLQRAHDENLVFHCVPTLTFWDALRTVRLKLWDPARGRLVTWAEAAAPEPSRA